MAEIAHRYVEDNTSSNTTTTTTVTVVSGGNLTANTKYLLIVRALIGSESVTGKVVFNIETADDTNIATKSISTYEMESPTSGSDPPELKSWFFAHSYTTDATPAGIAYTLTSDDAATVVTIDNFSLIAIDLDAIGTAGTDYYEDINAATGTELSTSLWGTTLASLSGLSGTEEWLAFGSAKIGVGSTGRSFSVKLDGYDDAASTSILNEVTEEGEDTAEERMVGLVGRSKASSGNAGVFIRAYEEAASGNMTDEGSYLIALPTSFFADFEHDYTAGAISTAGVETTVASVGPYTPTTNGNHLIIGRFNKEPDSADVMGWLEDGTTETRTGDSLLLHNQNWDTAKDAEAVYTMERISISTAKTYNLRADDSGANNYDALYRWLIVLNLNEAATPTVYPPFPRRKQTTVRM